MTEELSWVAGLIIGICIVLILLPPKWDPAIRLKERQEWRRWIVWYIEPAGRRRQYLVKGSELWWYSPNRDHAHRFNSKAEAESKIPVYDGSANLTKRVGVERAR